MFNDCSTNKKMKPTFTEVSISFSVTEQPKISIHNDILALIDTRATDIVRILNKKYNNIPEWMMLKTTKSKDKILRFIYDFKIQHIECMYIQSTNIFIFYKIKYENFEILKENVLNQFFLKLNIAHHGIKDVRFKALGELPMIRPWNKAILADIITTNPRIFTVMALREKALTIHESRLFSLSFSTNLQFNYVSVTLTAKNNIVVTMSKLANEETAIVVMQALKDLLEIYNIEYDNLYQEYEEFIYEDDIQYNTDIIDSNAIKYLRSQVPELFINNYTRECPILPIILDEQCAQKLKDQQRVILYPLTGSYSRYYTAPDGYFVGLKTNRLKNKNIFPYLVTCYLSDHIDRKSSITYKYYINDNVHHRHRSNKRIPRSLSISNNYSRKTVKNKTFIGALEVALNVNIDPENLPWCPQIAKQELWDFSDKQIMNIIKNKEDYGVDVGSCVYRYFEELLKISIHVIPINSGHITTFISRHKDSYIWNQSYDKHIVIFEDIKNIYGKLVYTYDILTKSNRETILEDNDSIIETVLLNKKELSIESPINMTTNDIQYQIIDRRGKCRQVITQDNTTIDVYTRPLPVEILPRQKSFVEEHVHKLNSAKKELSFPTIELTNHSTHHIRYFPNELSFQYWITQCRPQSSESS